MLTATSLELLTSYILEYSIGSWPWQTYEGYNINFQGRIALSPAIRFGIGGTFFLFFIQPMLDNFMSKVDDFHLIITSISLAVLLLVDFLYTHACYFTF